MITVYIPRKKETISYNNMDSIKEVNMKLSFEFDMTDLSAVNFIMGMEIKRNQTVRKLWLNQRKYIETVLKCFNMQY
jgi:hypothetical protein